MKRTPLERRTPLKRTAMKRGRPKVDNRPHPSEVIAVIARDGGCIALKYDPSHSCEGRITMAHVPERGKNALGVKPPSDRYHMVAECLKANSGGTQPWSETHRDVERRHLAKFYPDRYPVEL